MKKEYKKPECQVYLFEKENVMADASMTAIEVALEDANKDTSSKGSYILQYKQ